VTVLTTTRTDPGGQSYRSGLLSQGGHGRRRWLRRRSEPAMRNLRPEYVERLDVGRYTVIRVMTAQHSPLGAAVVASLPPRLRLPVRPVAARKPRKVLRTLMPPCRNLLCSLIRSPRGVCRRRNMNYTEWWHGIAC
jgi:hypothetical protein